MVSECFLIDTEAEGAAVMSKSSLEPREQKLPENFSRMGETLSQTLFT